MPGSYPAGGAFSARFFLREIQKIQGQVDRAGVFVHDNHTARSHDRTGSCHRFIFNRDIEKLFGKTAARRPPGLNALVLLPGAAANFEDDVAELDAQRNFHQPGPTYFADQRKSLGAVITFDAVLTVPIGTVSDNARQNAESFDIVDNGRFAEQAGLRREWRPRTGHPSFAFYRSNQCRFFAADKSAGALLDDNVKVESGAQNVIAKQPAFAHILGGYLQTRDGQMVTTVDVDIPVVGADSKGGNGQTFQNTVRVALDQRTVHERPRIALGHVAYHVLGFFRETPADFPFLEGWETGTASAPQTG